MAKEAKEQIKDTSITAEMRKSYLDYAMSVIVSRALPDVRDGLKPVQRRIIYAMHKQGVRPTANYSKCAAVVGETMKRYHPHGDMAIYDALVRMGQPFSLRYPLIDGQGNFGSIDGDPAAAMRYTECRLSKIAEELLRDIEKETVDFEDNYSGTDKEPGLLPSTIPNLLLNGVSGIAVGMATNIPPHNLSEVVDALVFMIGKTAMQLGSQAVRQQDAKTDKLSNCQAAKLNTVKLPSCQADIDDLLQYIRGPDFPTGGQIFDQEEIRQTFTTGRGHIVMRAKTEIKETKKDRFAIVISELPYQVNKATLVAKIADLVKSGRIKGISDLRDESDREGLRIVVEIKKDARAKQIQNRLYKYTDLQTPYHANFVALINGEPKTLSLKAILEEFIRHRFEIVTRRSQFLLEKAKQQKHILQGLKIALDHLDEVIATIKRAPDAETAKERLVKKFKLTEIQAQAILDMQLKRLARLEREKILEELKEVIKTIKELEALLVDPRKILDRIKKDLERIKKDYGDERRTKVYKGRVGEFAEEELIPKEDVIVTLTESGYIKRMPLQTFRRQQRGGKGVLGMETKEEDVVREVLTASTHDRVLFFTNRGRVFDLQVWDIPEAGRTARGQAVVNLLNLGGGEKVTSCLVI